MEKQNNHNNSNAMIEWFKHIRMHPGLYIGRRLGDGSSYDDGIYQLLKEVVDNSIDEFVQGHGKCIEVTINDNVVSVRDYGRGITFNKMVHCMTNLIPGENAGIKPTNALSNHFIVQSILHGHVKAVEFSCGKFIRETSVKLSNQPSGTLTTFTIDDSIFGNYRWDSRHIKKMFWEFACLNNGLTINFNGQKIVAKNGLYDFLCDKVNKDEMLYEPIHFKDKFFEFVFTHTTRNCNEEYYSFVNRQYTPNGGTHLKAFRKALVKTFCRYYNKKFTPKKICNAIAVAIVIKVQEPIFGTDMKTELISDMIQVDGSTISDYVEQTVSLLLGNYLHEHPDVGNIIRKKIIEFEPKRKTSPK